MKRKQYLFYSVKHDHIVVLEQSTAVSLIAMMIRHDENFHIEFMYLGEL